MSDTIWGIHAGRTGDADSLFLNQDVVALGWPEVGDLSKIEGTREAFKDRLESVYRTWSLGKIRTSAGQLFRFMHEIERGHLIAYSSRADRQIHIGRIESDYQHRPDLSAEYPQVRKVKWLQVVPRTAFSQGALYELGSAMSFFMLKTYAEEYLATLDKGRVAQKREAEPEEEDESIGFVAEDIEDQTRDFVLKQLWRSQKGLPLEDFIKHLLECMGYKVRLTRKNEPSVDLIAHKDDLGLEPPIIKVQVKSTEGKVGDRDVSALYGKLEGAEYGLFITLGELTPPALNFASNKSNLRLIDGVELVDLIFEHYDKFDARYKGILPLKRVYIPQTS